VQINTFKYYPAQPSHPDSDWFDPWQIPLQLLLTNMAAAILHSRHAKYVLEKHNQPRLLQ